VIKEITMDGITPFQYRIDKNLGGHLHVLSPNTPLTAQVDGEHFGFRFFGASPWGCFSNF
jgi:hypothetical protein